MKSFYRLREVYIGRTKRKRKKKMKPEKKSELDKMTLVELLTLWIKTHNKKVMKGKKNEKRQ